MANRSRVRRSRGRSPSLIERVNPNAAGIDCGSAEHYVAVPRDRDPEPVRSFKAFTADLRRLAEWLVSCRITTVAMEATGVYWIPLYEILEERGIECVLVNARHVKNVPGRKSDVSDCEWLQELHSVGLLRGSFRPVAEITALRTYLRHRDTLIQGVTTHIQRIQKALVQMNLQLHLVISDVAGVTGLRILRDIVAGRTDPKQLAKHRDLRCRASEQEIEAALTGHYRPEQVFVVQEELALFDAYQARITSCDTAIAEQLDTLSSRLAVPDCRPLLAPRSKRKPYRNQPAFEIRSPLHRMTGTDLTQIDGIAPYTALRLISEVGTDMTKWPTEQHFTSWLTLAPRNKVSGGKLLGSRTQPSANRAAAIFRLAAMSLTRTQTALGAYFRRLAFRIGKPKAITATARKLAILVYRSLKGGFEYKDPGPATYDARYRATAVRRLTERAAALGYALLNRQTGELLETGVS